MIPDFLKRENRTEKREISEMKKAIDRYNKQFNNDLITETVPYSDEEWVEVLNYCVENNMTIWEYWGEEYDPEADY